ncbi:MAG TPA: 2-dehydro-3-deoxygalactonokinase [Beijerinckiaceae bacterium]|jgi:2-dehydro-3-deoxygalactonokinase|nr:2-dehydro-3-deoxygalactonokinase [Beijerinckiaceae bacterium]
MKASPHPPRCIVLDWGTTSFRALLVDANGAVLDRVETQDGIQSVPKTGFEAVLARNIASWRHAHTALPVYAAGMITSRNGWIETPYVEAPAGADALAAAVKWLRLADGGVIGFIPGLTDKSVKPFPDVMRGEETQLVGFGLGQEMTVVLPGTHSKWARIEKGRIARFRTFVTGEIFALLSRHSFIAQLSKPQPVPNWSAFTHGLEVAGDRTQACGLLSHLFSVRTGWLAGKLAPPETSDYLSGLVVGMEFREAREMGWFKSGERVGIIGGDHLVEVYRRAAIAFGLEPDLGPSDAAVHGALVIAEIAERRGHGV